MVLLTSLDNQEFRTEKDVISRSGLVRNFMESDDEYENMTIPLPNVNGAILKKVLVFCEHHRYDPVAKPFQPFQDEDYKICRREPDMSEWDKNYFAAMDQPTLFKVIIAAHYLEIHDLSSAGSRTVADMIKGKNSEEIRQTFGIVKDFTPEEDEQIRRENAWAEDR